VSQRREALLSAAVVAIVAIAVRLWAATVITFPRPEDTAYYVGVARHLIAGDGLVTNAIWSFTTPPLTFPRPAFEVWLPLATFLDAIPMALLRSAASAASGLSGLVAAFRDAQWTSILEGALVAVLTWRLAADVAAERSMPAGRARTLAVGAGLTAAVFLPLVLYSVLPDSTLPFAALVLVACLLAGRVARNPRGARATDPRVLALGIVLGVAALARNEAIWLALAWLIVARGIDRDAWLRLVLGAAVPAILVFAPWMVRDWAVFGSPFPGQALSNALSLDSRDIFAWQDPPTLGTYLAAGLPTLIGLRWDGFLHNLGNVLLLPGVPIAAIGLVGLPWTARGAALRLLTVFSIIAFVATTLLFPVATTSGTFLHASAAVQVLLLVSALLVLDVVLVAIGRRRGWHRPVAWLGPTLGIAAGALFTVVLLGGFGSDGDAVRARYAALPDALRAAGAYPTGAVITDAPIYLAEATGLRSLALPDESPDSVLSLARAFPGTSLVIVSADNEGRWPEIAATDPTGVRCFEPVELDATSPASVTGPEAPLADVLVYRITCPSRRADAPLPSRTRTGKRQGPGAGTERRGGSVGSGSLPARSRLPSGRSGLVYSRRMNGEPDSEPRDGRREELMAEAQAAVAYSANSLRSIRERYREQHLEQVSRWEGLRDALSSTDRRVGDVAVDAGTPGADSSAVAAEAGAADARLRALRRDEAIAARSTGAEAAELARLELALKSLERVWLFLSREDASLVSDPEATASEPDTQMRIIEAQEAERTRLAREVHDGPAQALANASFQVEIVERNLARDPALAAAELRLLRDLLRRELGDVRAFISQLRPPILADLGLTGAIRDTADQVGGVLGIPVTVTVDPAVDDLPDATETVILRIIQEALQNVRRHASAGSASIVAERHGDGWSVEIRDDGRGFDVGAVAARGRRNFGLQFMRERAELIGARFEVRSRPDGGTVVRIAATEGAEETV
jgi:two-component system sensor histidine kinase DegS